MQDRILDKQEVEWQFETLDLRPVARWLENRPREQKPGISFRGTAKYEAGLFASGLTPPATSVFGPTEVDG